MFDLYMSQCYVGLQKVLSVLNVFAVRLWFLVCSGVNIGESWRCDPQPTLSCSTSSFSPAAPISSFCPPMWKYYSIWKLFYSFLYRPNASVEDVNLLCEHKSLWIFVSTFFCVQYQLFHQDQKVSMRNWLELSWVHFQEVCNGLWDTSRSHPYYY